jgi:hypothetical protein
MTPLPESPSAVLFAEAARRYVEGHQACAWCGESHCVFQTERDGRVEYSCNRCDFYVCQDCGTGQCHAMPGVRPVAVRAS